MAKKLLTSDIKLSWIRDTRGGVNKLPDKKIATKAEKPPAKSVIKKNSKQTEPAAKAKKIEKKAVIQEAAKPKTALKVAIAKKRPIAAKTSIVASAPIKPLDKTIKARRKPKPAPKPKTDHASQVQSSSSHQTHDETPEPVFETEAPIEEASEPIEETSAPMEEIPMFAEEIPLSMEEVPAEKRILGKLLYLFSIAALICAAIFLPERYSMFVFLGFIFIALIEVSYRVGEQYNLLKSISESRNSWPALLGKR